MNIGEMPAAAGLDWVGIAGLLSAIAAAISAVMAARATRYVRDQVAAQNKAIEAEVFLRIYDEWNRIYPSYRAALAAEVPWDLLRSFEDPRDFMKTDQWMEIRSVLVFYEFIAGCVKRELLDVKFLRDLVNINPALWEKYRALIVHLRDSTGQEFLYKEMENVLFKQPVGRQPAA